jgi:hypothetical protein
LNAPRIAPCLAALVALSTPCLAEQPCAGTIGELRALVGDPSFPLRWQETTMRDGKPLELRIAQHGPALLLSIIKQGEGVWVEGSGTVCTHGDALAFRFTPGTMNVGSAAHWAVRVSLSAHPDFTLSRLGPDAMKLAIFGWSGTFAAQ